MFIVDAHLDVAYNALNHGRTLTQTLAEIRQAERRPGSQGQATVSLPALQKAGVGLLFGTLFAVPAHSPFLSDDDGPLVYHNAAEAHRWGMAQLDYYHRLADEMETVKLVTNQTTLQEVLTSHQSGEVPLTGIVPLMEGADPVREPPELEYWFERGLRIIGPAWDDTRYSPGAWRDNEASLPADGFHLLEVMASFGFILDTSHMGERAMQQALDMYEGPVIASHSNARVLVNSKRHLSDEQIQLLGERDAVIGIALYNRFLRANHLRGAPKALVTLDHVLAHIDHICQVLGDARHVGIGSDLDGGFGRADIPAEMDSVADLPLIGKRLAAWGYTPDDVAHIMGRNWLRLLQRSLPS